MNRQALAPAGPPSAGPNAGKGQASGAGQRELCAWDDGVFIGDALPAPGAARPSAQPSGSSRPVRGTGHAEFSGFGNAGNVIRNGARPTTMT